MDYVPVQRRGKTTLLQACQILVLGFRRLLSEANVYANSTNDVYIMVYVDDIMVIGDPTKVNKIREKIQEKMLLKHTGYLDPGEKHYFLGRQIHNKGNYFDIKLDDDYIEAILQEGNMTKCNPAPTPPCVGVADWQEVLSGWLKEEATWPLKVGQGRERS